MIKFNPVILLIIMLIAVSCSEKDHFIDTTNIDSIGVSFVKLSFALSRYDMDFVDGYFGPESIKTDALRDTLKLKKIIELSDKLLHELNKTENQNDSKRAKSLKYLILSLKTRAEILSGKKYSFDEESRLIFNAACPIYSPEIYRKTLASIDSLLPGKGSLNQRWNDFRRSLIIPQNKLDTVFKRAIEECRQRTLKYITLPAAENFRIELINNAPWGAYNWYKGNSQSLIQVNSGLPFYIDKALDIACHEGYPGHHVFHTLNDSILYRKNKMIEYSLIPLFSPRAILSEGLENFGIEITFSKAEKINFEKNVLCKLAGISTEKLDKYYKILSMKKQLRYAGIEAARRYLDGRMSKEMVILWLMDYELRTKEEAENSVKFMEKYRSYIITYSVGYEMLVSYFNRFEVSCEEKWKLYYQLLTRPVLPEDLR